MTGHAASTNAAGFTLLEMLVVVTIVAIVAALLPFTLTHTLASRRVTTLAEQLAGDLRNLRTEAIHNTRETRLVITRTPQAWIEEPAHHTHLLPEGVIIRLEAGGLVDQPAIIFAPDGASNGGRVWLESDKVSREISVGWLTGRVHVSR